VPDTSVNPKLYNGWVRSNTQDFWMAKAFKLQAGLSQKYPLMRIIAAARMQRTGYASRPYLFDSTYTQRYIGQTRLLGAIGIAHWDYYIDHNVYNLDKGEYFPKGISLAVIGGFQDDDVMQRRSYFATALQYGKAFDRTGYLLCYLKAGGFISPQGLNQVLIDWQNTFYTINLKIKKTNLRQFIYTNIKIGIDRPRGNEIVADNNNGLRGVSSSGLQGSSTYGLSYELDLYMTHRVYGFSASWFSFADLTLVDQGFHDQVFQSGIGAGMRIRNVNLGLGFIELTFAYYPNLEIAGQQSYSILANSISNRSPVKRDLFGPDIVSAD
jgi:hypothetical protein